MFETPFFDIQNSRVNLLFEIKKLTERLSQPNTIKKGSFCSYYHFEKQLFYI